MSAVTYLEQQAERKDRYFKESTELTFDSIYDEAVKNTEEIFMERLRNKLTPIVTLISMCEHIDYGDDKIKKAYNNIKPWISADNAVKEILEITKT